ncbi:MAG: SDR family oxidoreductase [Armatimonadota bacterium]|nr:SDR family oxidoreductase [bacterium]
MQLFSLEGKNAVVLGGAGILGTSITKGIAAAGASVAVADISEERSVRLASELKAGGTNARGYVANAMDELALQETCDKIYADFGHVDILINAVGGNRADATCMDADTFFTTPASALQSVVNLNLFGGAILPSQIFGRRMSSNSNGGSIINISSMCAFRPLTRVVGYSAAKAAVSNFTQWLAVCLAQGGYPNVRVNAIAPGFFLTEQNRFLLTDKDTGELTARGHSILSHTPMARFGEPEDLNGTVVWLASDASRFVTGIVVPIDGGFSAFSGV